MISLRNRQNRMAQDLSGGPANGWKRRLLIVLPALLWAALLVGAAAAQDDPEEPIPKDAEPPPLKVISMENREKLDDQRDAKKRVKLSLELLEGHLMLAEEHSVNGDYKAMFKDLGKFHAMIDNTIAYLIRNDTGNSRFLNNFKLFEMGLRGYLPRLELIRRDAPPNFEYYIRMLIRTVRTARQQAVDPFFDDAIVPNNNPKGKN